MSKTQVIYSSQGRYKKNELKYIESSCGFKNYLERDVINFCCHVTNYHKLNGLNNALYLTISVGQNSGQDIIGFSAHGLKCCNQGIRVLGIQSELG